MVPDTTAKGVVNVYVLTASPLPDRIVSSSLAPRRAAGAPAESAYTRILEGVLPLPPCRLARADAMLPDAGATCGFPHGVSVPTPVSPDRGAGAAEPGGH